MYGLLSSENEKNNVTLMKILLLSPSDFLMLLNVLKTYNYDYMLCRRIQVSHGFSFHGDYLLFGTLVLFFLIHLFATSNIADVVSDIQNLNEKFVVPVTAAEFQVMRTALSVCCYLIFIN